MELLRWELRKIWRPGVLAAIVLLGAVYYWMFPEFYMEYFRKGPESSGMAYFALASEWVELYGPTLEGKEWAELEERLAEEIAAFDRQVAAIPEAAAAGITSYEAFLAFREDDPAGRGEKGEAADKERRALIDRVYGGPTGTSSARWRAAWKTMRPPGRRTPPGGSPKWRRWSIRRR